MDFPLSIQRAWGQVGDPQVVFKAFWLSDFAMMSMDGSVSFHDFTTNLVKDPKALATVEVGLYELTHTLYIYVYTYIYIYTYIHIYEVTSIYIYIYSMYIVYILYHKIYQFTGEMESFEQCTKRIYSFQSFWHMFRPFSIFFRGSQVIPLFVRSLRLSCVACPLTSPRAASPASMRSLA